MTAKQSERFGSFDVSPAKFWSYALLKGAPLQEFVTYCQTKVVAKSEFAVDFLRALRPLSQNVRIPRLKADILQEIASFYRDPGLQLCGSLPPHEVEAALRELAWLRDQEGRVDTQIRGAPHERLVELFLELCFADPRLRPRTSGTGMATEPPSALPAQPATPPPAAPPAGGHYQALPAPAAQLALPGPSRAEAAVPEAASAVLVAFESLLQSVVGLEPLQATSPDAFADARRQLIANLCNLFRTHSLALEQELRAGGGARVLGVVELLARCGNPADPILPVLLVIENLVAQLAASAGVK